ncbi:organic solute carrier partner 1 [Trypanosoma theileri]|uniref:Organic solute carrier partner 1 n=1 Tax=Trypanosoma theileri TaxID=67003 RepID=A0A1X0NSP8_9TRYP|nr:organic solute carrier partner 1 [Trypanosoma theileri]ORC87722.1 organic solute carrier partner 1 [Trypanosoma theileri]
MTIGSLPFLILNYGAELIFILHTRLIAQKVNSEAARIVMNDVVGHMFSSEFIDELLRPQPLHSLAETKEVFISLTQTSVMRLSAVSMKKLFDLMTTGVKYQLFTLRHPLELLELTWTHLEEVQRIITPESQMYVRPVLVRLKHLCSNLNIGDLAEIRKELLNFFVGRSVPVSVLLDDGLQTSSGSFFLPEDRFLPPLAVCEPPGTIRYFNNGTLISSEVFTHHRDANLRYPLTIPPGTWDPMNPVTRVSKNGMNMYTAYRGSPDNQSTNQPPSSSSNQSERMNAVTGELNYLSQLIRGNQKTTQETFKLSLFDDGDEDDYDDDNNGNEKDGKNTKHMALDDGVKPKGESIHTSAAFSNHTKKEETQTDNTDLMRIVEGFRIDKTVAKPTGGNSDLLDIMDED